MKTMRKATLFVMLAVTFTLAPIFTKTISAEAGASRANVATEASIVDGHINTGDFMISGGVHGEADKIVFDENCAESSKIIGKTKLNNLGAYGIKNLLNGKMTVELKDLVKDGGVFSVCFGMTGLSSKRDDIGVVEMRFYERNGVNFVVYEHCDEGISNVLLTSKQYTAMQNGGVVALEFSVTTDGAFTLTLNGEKKIEKTLYEGGEGYFGIFSEGKNVVSIENLSLFGYSYEAPENVDYTETFDGNAYNANMFYTMSKVSPLTPSYLTVEDGALKFSNTAGAHITTRYTYSNFELQFDVTDLQRTAVYDENGNIVKLISNWFSIAFGVDSPEQLPESTFSLATSLQVEGMFSDEEHDQTVPSTFQRFVLRDKGSVQKIDAMNYNIWDAERFDGKIVQVKLSVYDGLIRLWMKTADENEWGDAQFTYDLGYTPSGYVRIFTWGQNSVVGNGLQYNSIANFTIDNLSIKNSDYESVRNVTTVEYKSNYIADTADYVYTTKTDDGDLLQNRLEEVNKSMATGCGSVLGTTTLTPLLGALAIATFFKGGKKDE